MDPADEVGQRTGQAGAGPFGGKVLDAVEVELAGQIAVDVAAYECSTASGREKRSL